MSTYTITHQKPILVVKSGEEGGFRIFPIGNGETASFDPSKLPDWASDEQIVLADLKGLKEWLVKRIGDEEYTEMALKGDLSKVEFDAITWTCITDTEEIVERAASADVRAEWLGDLLGFEREVADFDAIKADAEALHKSYAETPTNERSLAEAEGKTFEEAIKEQARQYR